MPDTSQCLIRRRTHCPACQSDLFEAYYREPLDSPAITAYMARHYHGKARWRFTGCDYEVARCTACGLHFQPLVPTRDLLCEIYDEWLPASERAEVATHYRLKDYRYLAGQLQFLLQHLNRPSHTVDVLDFGFGWAEWSKMAMAHGCNVSGAELSQARIDYGRSIGMRIVDGAALPDGAFDIIQSEQVFEHLVEPGEVLRRLARALKPHGVIKVSVPNAAKALARLRKARSLGELPPDLVMPVHPLEHINCFTHASLVAMGAQAGLKPLRPGLRKLYNSASGWLEPKQALHQLAREIYRHVYPKSTFIYFVLA